MLRQSRGPVPSSEHVYAGRPARHRAITRVLRELAGFGIRMHFDFRWAIDGSGVEEDKPLVVHLHRGMLRTRRMSREVYELADRVSSIDLVNTVRHEVGHALLFHRPDTSRTREFKRLFGDVTIAYRVGTAVAEIERRIHRHGGLGNPRYRRFISLYAAAHPHEAFAEAVRIALATGGDDTRIAAWVARHSVAPVIERQIRYAATWLARYRSTSRRRAS